MKRLPEWLRILIFTEKGYWLRNIKYTRKSLYFQNLIFSIVLLGVALTSPYAKIIIYCMFCIAIPYFAWKYARLYSKECPQDPDTKPEDFWRNYYPNGKLKRSLEWNNI